MAEELNISKQNAIQYREIKCTMTEYKRQTIVNHEMADMTCYKRRNKPKQNVT